MTQVQTTRLANPDLVRELRLPAIAAGVLVALVVAVFWEFFDRQVRWALREPADWGHTLVIPFISGYFVYLQWRQLQRVGFRTTWVGMVPVILGLGWYSLCVFGPTPLNHHNLHGLGVGLTLGGLTLLFCGWRALGYLLFPLIYLMVFGQTISDKFLDKITFSMQQLTAQGAHVLMLIGGMEVERHGNTLYVWKASTQENIPLNIAEACSGMRMLMAFLALGVAMAYTGLRRWWQRTLLVVSAVPVAIFVNVLRVVTLGLLSLINVNFAAGDFHTFIGLVWLVPAFLLFLGVLWIIKRLVIEGPGSREPSPGGG